MTSVTGHSKPPLSLADSAEVEANRLIEAFVEETASVRPQELRPQDYPGGRAVLSASAATQVAVSINLCERVAQGMGYPISHRVDKLAAPLMTRALPFDAADVERLMAACRRQGVSGWYAGPLCWGGVARVVRRFTDAGNALTPSMRETLTRLAQEQVHLGARSRSDSRKIKAAVAELLGDAVEGLPASGEPWADAARAEVADSAAWAAVFTHAATADGPKPSAKWLALAQRNRVATGESEFIRRVSSWMSLTTSPQPFNGAAPQLPTIDRATIPFNESQAYADYQRAYEEYSARVREYLGGISEKNISILKGLSWYSSACDSAELARALGHLGEVGFQNIPERGAWAKSAGNAALWALGQMPGGMGVGPLARLRTRLRDRSALKLIAASIEAAAKSANMTVNELEDLAVPTGGLDKNGTRKERFDMDGSAVLTLDAKNAKTNLQWFGSDGKPRKAVPAAVKANHAAEVKALKAAEEEIKSALSAQAARFDKFLLDEREWTYTRWKERYLSHPILGNIARRLIWTLDGVPFLPDDLPTTLPDTATVKLWHPLGAAPGDVLQWRRRLEVQEIVQPFKQAHREIYLLTDAERNTRTYSNRFAAHILKQHQFNSLCALRGWKNTLRLMVDDSYPPATRELPRHNLRAEFWVEGAGDNYETDANDAGTYLRLATDQVRFYPLDAGTNYAHAGGGGYTPHGRQAAAEPLPLDQVPALAFSEVMRDVDLFVGVASVGNDPTWADGGPQGRYVNYWQDYAFGDLSETAKTRADVLARLLPRLKIADRCRLDGKFLVVRGDLRTYKIHLGSGNILMEPNDQYLCIVPGSRAEDGGDLFLPFAGDRVLAVVLSKAFLLAADTKIADPTITRQIRVD